MTNKKSKKMVVTENEIAENQKKQNTLLDRQSNIIGFEAVTPNGKDARTQAIDKITIEMQELKTQEVSLKTRLEVETVAFLSGEDTEIEPLFNGQGGGSALRKAS